MKLEVNPMREAPDAIVMFISQDSSLIKEIQSIIEPIDKLTLAVCETIDDALPQLSQDDFALILVHLPQSVDESRIFEFLETVKTTKKTCPTLILSDEYRNHQAVAMLRAGAGDYVGLPQDMTKLAYFVDILTMRARGVEHQALAPTNNALSKSKNVSSSYILDPEIIEIMDQVRRVVAQDTTVLLTGKTGTGKTRLARLIHEISPRRDEPYLVVDCAAVSASLIESELFGHAKGAFTGADQDRVGKCTAVAAGTLVLDDINALPMGLQSKLLRLVDERVYEPVGSNQLLPLRARLIVATNAPLEHEVAAGRFRADLFYRLNVVGFYLPPLRERRQAITRLADRFLAEFLAKSGVNIHGISPAAMRLLVEYDWPGNIRELRNVIERAALLSPGPLIQTRDLPQAISSGQSVAVAARNHAALSPAEDSIGAINLSKEEAESLRITEALLKHGNNRLRAAAELGISRMSLYNKMHKYGLIQPSVRKGNGKVARRQTSKSK